VTSVVLALAAAVVAAQLPTPTKLVQARAVFVAGDGGRSAARDRFGCSAWEGWKADADAVVAVNINFRPSMFSWASPHAEGMAVRWNAEGRKQFPAFLGQCFPRPDP
jgi:hypothetical protein